MANHEISEQEDGVINENDLEDILDQVPTLIRVRDFAKTLSHINWFTRVGETFEAEDLKNAQDYLDRLGFPDVAILPVEDWEQAADLAESPDFDTLSWEAEEQLRADLENHVLEQIDVDALSVVLTHLSQIVSMETKAATQNVAALWDIEDEQLLTAATGMALQTCHMYALGLLSDQDEDFPIYGKFELYKLGRWPIGITGSSFNLF